MLDLMDWADNQNFFHFIVYGIDGIQFLFIATPKKACGGLFVGIEKKLSLSQREWVSRLVFKGYRVETGLTTDEAKKIINDYL